MRHPQPQPYRHEPSNTELKSTWQNERDDRLQKARQKTTVRQERVAYERGKDGQTHKSGKRRPRVRRGRGITESDINMEGKEGGEW